MKKTASSKYNDLSTIENRVRYLLGSQLRDVDKIDSALKTQDEIRANHPSLENWDSASEIRKWRDGR